MYEKKDNDSRPLNPIDIVKKNMQSLDKNKIQVCKIDSAFSYKTTETN